MLVATIVANSGTGLDCDGEGALTDGGFNLDDDGSCKFSGTSLSDTRSGLDPAGLQNNGGPTLTIVLESGSAALSHVTLAAHCTGSDQRSEPWPTPCDIGAAGVVTRPTITSFTPTSGPRGTTVTINGTKLGKANRVTFNGASAAISNDTNAQLKVKVPPGATTGKIAVTTPSGSVTSTKKFTVT
jgi:hypothetical protein